MAEMRTSVGRPGGSSGQAQNSKRNEIAILLTPSSRLGVFPRQSQAVDWFAGQGPSSPDFAQVTNVPMHVSLFWWNTSSRKEYYNLCNG